MHYCWGDKQEQVPGVIALAFQLSGEQEADNMQGAKGKYNV